MTRTALYSQSWYRVSQLCPRLRSHVQIHRHVYRGQVWYVMQDHSNGEFHRYTPEAHLLIRLMNGQRTVQEIWDIACEQLADDAMPQEEVINLMAQLHRADVLLTNEAPDARELLQRRKRQRFQKIKQYIGNPSSLKIPLLDPDRWLDRTLFLVRWVFSWWGALLWLLIVCVGVGYAAMHWGALTHNIWDRVFSANNIVLMALIYPVVKAIHELGHAYAIKMRGAEVHEIGLMFLLLVPIPYVDASASWAFAQRRWRLLVGAAGIMVELFLAAVAMISWAHLEPGLARSIAYSVVLICGVSTLLMNGNPLLRYDGYYVLSDLLDMPNLAQRANSYVGFLFKRHILRLGECEAPKTAPGERLWLVLFAVLSFAYRMFIMVFASLIVVKRFFFIGVLIALWLLISSILMPLERTFRHLFTDPLIQRHRRRCYSITAVCIAMLILGVAVVPLPDATITQGVIWVPPEAQVRAPANGEIIEISAGEGTYVTANTLLFVVDSPKQQERLQVLGAKLDEYRARYQYASTTEQARADVSRHQWDSVQKQYEITKTRVAAQDIYSRQRGKFVVVHPGDMVGRQVKRGELLGYVMAQASHIRIILPQFSVDRIQGSQVNVRLKRGYASVIAASIDRRVPAATDKLPSSVLSLQAGGAVAIDPRKSARGQARAAKNLFIIDLALAEPLPNAWLGSRVMVRFPHPPRAILAKLYDWGRQLLLNQFGV